MHNNRIIATLSASFQEVFTEKLNAGYIIKDIVIENVVIWFDKENNKLLKHPLCKIVLKR